MAATDQNRGLNRRQSLCSIWDHSHLIPVHPLRKATCFSSTGTTVVCSVNLPRLAPRQRGTMENVSNLSKLALPLSRKMLVYFFDEVPIISRILVIINQQIVFYVRLDGGEPDSPNENST